MWDKPFPWVEKGKKIWDKGYSNVINELLVVSIVEISLIKRLGRLFKAQAWRKRIFTPKLMNLAKFRVSIGAPCLYQSEVSQTRDLYLETVRWWFSKIETVPHSVKIYPVFACGNVRQFTKKILITRHVFTCSHIVTYCNTWLLSCWLLVKLFCPSPVRGSPALFWAKILAF